LRDAAAQQDFDKVEIKATKVAGTVYMLEGSGGNIGVSAGEDGILIVDDQFAPLAPKIEAALKGIADKPLKFVLNTHWHGDHTGGNAAFGRKAPIIAQTNVRKRLMEGNAQWKIEPAPKDALPVLTFDTDVTLHFNGEDVRVVHYPRGHTDGDAIIYFPSANVLHMGDDFFNGRFPFIDVSSGGSVKGLIANIEKVLKDFPPGVKVIPGHGPLGTMKDLQSYLTMLKETSSAVAQAKKQGATADQMKKDKILSKYESWSWSVDTDRYIDILAGDPDL